MNTLSRIGAVLVLVGIATLIVGATGFTTTEADRPTNIDIVGDDDAYLGLEYEDRSVTGLPLVQTESEVILVNLTNRFTTNTSEVDVNITNVDNDDFDVTLSDEPADSMEVGETQSVYVDVECSPPLLGSESGTVSFNVSAEGDGFEVKTTEPRSIEITCESLIDISVSISINAGIEVGQGVGQSETTIADLTNEGDDLEDVTVSVTPTGVLQIKENGNPGGVWFSDSEETFEPEDGTWNGTTSLDAGETIEIDAQLKCAGGSTAGDSAGFIIDVTYSGEVVASSNKSDAVTCNP